MILELVSDLSDEGGSEFVCFGLVVFYGTSTFVDNLMPNPDVYDL